jgi:dTMP kinase
MSLLFTADRVAHFNIEITPLLDDWVVICDRYHLSTLAYQYGELTTDNWLLNLGLHCVLPDLIFYLKIDVDTALERVDKRNEEKEIYEEREILERVKERYDWLAATESRRCLTHTIDANQSIIDVHREVEGITTLYLKNCGLYSS